MSGKTKKIVKILAIVLASVAGFFALLFLGIFSVDRIAASAFYKRAEKQFAIPGTNSGFVGQGLDYLEDEDAFLACGYSAKKGKSSMVYYIDSKGKAKLTLLKNADGSNYTGHTGGIAHYREYVYITGDDGCDVFSLADFVGGKGESRMLGTVKSPMDPAYCNVHDGKFYMGSFYRAGNYETEDWQRVTTPAGDENKSVIVVYDIDDSATDTYYVSPALKAVYSTTELVQGMTFIDDQIVLSTSYAIASSYLKFYSTADLKEDTITLPGAEEAAPRYYLDGSCLTRDVKAPPMSEEIVYLNGKIYIMTESASNKYVFGKFTGATSLYAYKV